MKFLFSAPNFRLAGQRSVFRALAIDEARGRKGTPRYQWGRHVEALERALQVQEARRRLTGNRVRQRDRASLRRATLEGAISRARPLLMTVASDAIGLLPIMWGVGTGSETMRRIAAPMVGGVLSVTLVTLLVIPVLFVWLHGRALPERAPDQSR